MLQWNARMEVPLIKKSLKMENLTENEKGQENNDTTIGTWVMKLGWDISYPSEELYLCRRRRWQC